MENSHLHRGIPYIKRSEIWEGRETTANLYNKLHKNRKGKRMVIGKGGSSISTKGATEKTIKSTILTHQ